MSNYTDVYKIFNYDIIFPYLLLNNRDLCPSNDVNLAIIISKLMVKFK